MTPPSVRSTLPVTGMLSAPRSGTLFCFPFPLLVSHTSFFVLMVPLANHRQVQPLTQLYFYNYN